MGGSRSANLAIFPRFARFDWNKKSVLVFLGIGSRCSAVTNSSCK